VGLPDYQTLMRPLLALHADGAELDRRMVRASLAEAFRLTPEELVEMLPSGRHRMFDNRLSWATTYLVHAGLLERPRRGVSRITPRGLTTLRQHPQRIDNSVLAQFDEFRRFHQGAPAATGTEVSNAQELAPAALVETPEEALETAYQEARSTLAKEMLTRLTQQDPAIFEQVVLDVLLAIGYGGSRRDAAQRLGRSGDGGLDGVIYEDRLGMDLIYIQAKRWTDKTVGRPEIQAFVGALEVTKTSKGVFITTARFSKDAESYVERLRQRVVLIDGEQLTELMIEHGVGVTTSRTYEIKRMDEDYFSSTDL
jgi:restriction system protein